MTNKWDVRWLRVAREVASWSKDPSKQIGSVIVSPEQIQLAQGFNGFPRGFPDMKEWLHDHEMKTKFTIHAEVNAIFNAARSGTNVRGATCYVHGLHVCSKCALALVQSGITRIVSTSLWPNDQRWIDDQVDSKRILNLAGILYVHYLPDEI